MKLLGIETSTRTCSVAVSSDENIFSALTVYGSRRPSDHLMVGVERCLETAGFQAEELDAIAVGVGPGSFTGIRVGVTAAKSLAYALSKPAVAVSSLDVLAANVAGAGLPLWVVVDARKEKLYAALYEKDAGQVMQRQGDEKLLAFDQLVPLMQGDVLVLGDAHVRYAERFRAALGARYHILPPHLWVPQAAAVCRLAREQLLQGKTVAAHQLVPNYLFSSESDIAGW
ncbi:MAG: tRNA (adenosine(37)-N6)-threonylcarbamoyltransferase complex dimerization subunit type 1 TsaB [Candidatus Omnitrophica bacterium]|nr:tRNA (adenosine(37)-N6)-threonylcarbamoyltransferase complex dimerization subunit type 1 TsaB [Candidatus Omnitrophota bacterium]